MFLDLTIIHWYGPHAVLATAGRPVQSSSHSSGHATELTEMVRFLLGLLQYTNQDSPTPFLQVKIQLTDLCKTWFPKHTSTPAGCTNLASLIARMWQARKTVRALTDRWMTSIFTWPVREI